MGHQVGQKVGVLLAAGLVLREDRLDMEMEMGAEANSEYQAALTTEACVIRYKPL